jgi:hypothetical protein
MKTEPEPEEILLKLEWDSEHVRWQASVDEITFRLSVQAARRLARHLLLQCEGEGEKAENR